MKSTNVKSLVDQLTRVILAITLTTLNTPWSRDPTNIGAHKLGLLRVVVDFFNLRLQFNKAHCQGARLVKTLTMNVLPWCKNYGG
jgi:hypothetical protein